MYETTDLALATYLEMNFKIEDLERTDPRRVKFIFEDTPDLQTQMALYHSGHATVEPRKYFAALRDMKSRIYGSLPYFKQK